MNGEALALVLKTAPYKENSVLLTVLTKENGKQNVLCRGVKRSKKAKLYAEKFSYSKMRLYTGRGVPTVDEAELIEPFYGLRADFEKLCVAEYFAEVALDIPYGSGDESLLRLLLNSFALLSQGEIPSNIIKLVFELKFAMQEGFAPTEFVCECGKEAEVWSFERGFLCSRCAGGDGAFVSDAVKNAIRYILQTEGKRAYIFNMNHEALEYLGKLTEKYLQYHLGTRFETLDYYRKFTEAQLG